jgi:hypothetical protein
MNSAALPFDFKAFARAIYRERPAAHPQRLLLPALYGGEDGQRYEALFVLQEPSIQFTVQRWKACGSVEMAIQLHRSIFLDWAFMGKQAHLFEALWRRTGRGTSISRPEAAGKKFFRRFYVTDIWKDARFGVEVDRKYKDYWLAKLAIELQNVPARRVIFIGKEAERGRSLVRKGMTSHCIPFPSQWISEGQFKGWVEELMHEIRGQGRSASI